MTDPGEDPRGDDALARRLSARRPAPSRSFGDRLRARLLAEDAGIRRPARLWALVGAYGVSGAVLLIIAAVLA
jgi:hypothetical protein